MLDRSQDHARARRRGARTGSPRPGYDPAYGARPLKRVIQQQRAGPARRQCCCAGSSQGRRPGRDLRRWRRADLQRRAAAHTPISRISASGCAKRKLH
ncbi:MAG: hypothetical protein MZV49_22275 [Rhodopseudomonas palustris]|nr:hypothetical protein [Rhodopseudomonas palustris]